MSTIFANALPVQPHITCVLYMDCKKRCPKCAARCADLHEISAGKPMTPPEVWANGINSRKLPVILEGFPLDGYPELDALLKLIDPAIPVTIRDAASCSANTTREGATLEIGFWHSGCGSPKSLGVEQNWEHPEVACTTYHFLYGPDGKRYPCYRLMGLERNGRQGESISDGLSDAAHLALTVPNCGQFGFCTPLDDEVPGFVVEPDCIRKDPFTRKDVAIVLTSQPRVQMFLRESLASLRGWDGGPIILAYDDIDDKPIPWDTFDVKSTHVVCGGFPNMQLGWAQSMLYLMKIGMEKAQELGYQMIFKAEADETFYRWRNLDLWLKLRAEKKGAYLGAKASDWVLMRTNQCLQILDWIDLTPKHNVVIAEPWFGRQRLAFGWGEIPILPTDRINVLGSFHIHYEYATNKGVDTREIWKEGEIWPRKK